MYFLDWPQLQKLATLAKITKIIKWHAYFSNLAKAAAQKVYIMNQCTEDESQSSDYVQMEFTDGNN